MTLDLFILAGFSSMISKTITNPIEIIQVTQQVNKGSIYIFKEVADIYKKENIKGFFKGNYSNLSRTFLSNGITYIVFENLRQLGYNNFFSSLCGSFVSTSLTHPLEIIRTNLMLQKNKNSYKGIKDIIKSTRVKNLYNGYGITCTGRSIYNVISLSFFYSFPQNAFNGFLSGAMAISVSYPTEIIRRRIYLQKSKVQHDIYNSVLDCIKKIYKQEGLFGFYKGYGISVFRASLSQGLYFFFYENLKKFFNN